MTALLAPLALVWALPLLSDGWSLLKVIAGFRGRREPQGSAGGQRLLCLVPAHDEAGQIGPCVESILASERGDASLRLIVVADNCTDTTAEEATAAGAEAWMRSDPERPGKPPAIQWALDQVDMGEYDALLIVDADTVVERDFVKRLAASGRLTDRVVQAYYGLQAEERSWVSMLGGLLVRSRYEGQYQLRRLARLNSPMTGNGMCIGSGVLSRCGWADDALTENWEMYARYTVERERIDLVAEARLEALEPATMGESSVRRQRWQAGKWAVVRKYARPLFGVSHVGLHQRIDILAELLSPGPVAHGGVGVVVGVPVLLFAPTTTLALLGWVMLLSPLPTVAWTLHAIARHPHRGRVALAMVRLPFYLLWRVTIVGRALPTYMSGVWQRSPRPGDS